MKKLMKLVQQMKVFVLTGITLFSFHFTSAQNCNLVQNGSFEAGYTGFNSSYCQNPNGNNTINGNFGCYVITNLAPQTGHTANCGTNFMFVDGFQFVIAGPIWSQNVNMVAGASYTFCFTVVNLNPNNSPSNALIVNVGNQTILNTGLLPNTWSAPLCATFTATGPALISINETVTIPNGDGNDYGIDCITLTGPISVSTTATPVTCNGACDGTATATPNSGAAPYSYLWSNLQAAATATNLCSGTYTVTVTDTTGCTGTASVTISQPALLTVTATGTSVSWNGACDGTATATVAGGTQPYSYSWNSNPVQTTATATGLPIGIYIVIVTDANGCSATASVSINGSCPDCSFLANPNDPKVSPIPDQSCWWSTGGNSAATVDGNNNFLGTTSSTPLRFQTSTSEKMRITAGGLVGINTSSPSEYLDVDGDGRFRTLPSLNDNNLTKIVAVDNTGKLFYRDASTFGGFANNCPTARFVPKVDAGGNLVCSQIYDLFPEIGIATTNLLGIAQTGQLGLKCLGQSYFADNDNAVFRAYNPITNYSVIVGCGPNTDDLIPRGLMLNSFFPSYNNATDLLCMYIDDKQTARFMTLGNLSVYRDRIYKQDMWGIDPARGVVMAPDFITEYQLNGKRYDAKLWVESNSNNHPSCWYDNSNNNGFSAGVFVNNQNNLWIAFNKTGVYGVSVGQAANYAYGPQNIGGNFIAQKEHTNIAVLGRAINLPVEQRVAYNYGGYFIAQNASTVNYGVFATAPLGNCQNGSCFDAAGYFAGDVFTNAQYFSSDSKLKNNIEEIKNAADLLKKLKPYKYEYKRDKYASMNLPQGLQYGFLAEDVENILPTLVKSFMQPDVRDSLGKITEKGVDFKALNYIGLIPFIVQGFQEQQQQLETKDSEIQTLKDELREMKNKLDEFQSALSECCTEFENRLNNSGTNSEGPWLEQNVPNPFNQKTVIKYYVPQSASSASINIYSLDGAKLQSFNISQKGAGEIEISGSTLAPGTYVYHLLVNGKQIDGKLMTLTK